MEWKQISLEILIKLKLEAHKFQFSRDQPEIFPDFPRYKKKRKVLIV